MSITRNILRQVMLDNQKDVEQYKVFHRDYDLDSFPLQVFVGVRRSGKSFLLFQKMHQMLAGGHGWEDMLYIDFEDRRLEGFTADDFNLILECHRGRYIPVEVYPFSFTEYLDYLGIPHDELALEATESKARFMKAYGDYLTWGGLPESVSLPVKRSYLSSVFQKIYLGDIAQRNGVSNPKLLQLLTKKIAESVMQPISYNRLAKILSSVAGKVSVPTVSSYVSYSEDAWLLLRLRNIASAFAERESVCKYYYIDNGLLSIQLMNADTLRLENAVALSLFRKYGHDVDNERVYFYNTNVEVDFYVPEEELAVQASYSLADESTRKREVDALSKLPNVHPCKSRVIVTYDEEDTITDKHGVIEIVPCWKWFLSMEA